MSGAEADFAALPVGVAVEAVVDLGSGRAGAGRCTALWRPRVLLRGVRRIDATTGALGGIELRFLAVELRPVGAISWTAEATAWRAALNRWCLSVMGSMMGCVVADGGFGVGRRDGWL